MSDSHPSLTHSTTRGLADTIGVLGHPADLLAHPGLTATEKRRILAGWASDAHAVRDAPGLRQLDSGAVVAVDEILQALRTLDGADPDRSPMSRVTGSERRRRSLRSRLKVLAGRRDDDDDPPPSPAAACPPALALARRRKWDTGGGREPAAA